MSAVKELYRRIEGKDALLERCPVCGAVAELWRYSEYKDSPSHPVVMCSNGEKFGPQEGFTNEGCLLYMPPEVFYQSREIEAINYWNDYAIALNKLREANHGR